MAKPGENLRTTSIHGHRSPILARIAAALAALCLAGSALAPAAGAETFGQVGSAFGSYGTGNAQFTKPGMLGVDPVDGSIYGADIATSGENFRVQKLSPTGTFEASALIPRTLEGNILKNLHGIAVDHGRGRFYVIDGCRVTKETTSPCRSVGGVFGAVRILVYNTTPSGSTLVPASPATLSLPSGSQELYKPHAIAVDPTNHDLVVLAEDEAGHLVIQRFDEETGASIARFADSTNVLKPSGTNFATGIAVAPDHTTYTLTGASNLAGAGNTRAWKLPENLASVSAVQGFAAAAEAEGWTYGLTTYTTTVFDGPQIAISPDGDTLYWKEVVGLSSETEAGSIKVRGYSLTENATNFLYGGAEEGSLCKITTTSSAIGAAGDKLVVFDFGPASEAAPPYGDRVVTFGPGGSGCPQGLNPKLKVNGTEAAEVTVTQGQEVSFDATESQLFGKVLEEVGWNFGDGTILHVTEGGPSEVALHTFSAVGAYTVRLRLRPQDPNVASGILKTTVKVVSGGPKCTGANISGRGTMLQRIAQQEVWAPEFGSTICPSGPTVGYNATGTIAGREWNQFGDKGSINTGLQFIGTDVPPTTGEISNITGVAGGADLAVIPVAQTSISIVANPPSGCAFEEGTGITNVELQRVFRGTLKDWASLEGTTGSCSSPIVRVVSRKDGTGSTFQLKDYLSLMNGGALPCVEGRTWKQLRPIVPPTGAPNTTWPESCEGTVLSEVIRPSTNDDGAIVDLVNVTDGGIGYSATPDAKAHVLEGTTAIVSLQSNGKVALFEAEFANPDVGDEANCGSTTYYVPKEGRKVAGASGLNVDWGAASGAHPAIGGPSYPLCMLTYALAFHGYQAAGFNWGKYVTAKDYLKSYVVAAAGQEAMEGDYYAPLPSAGTAVHDVFGAARYAAGKVSW